MATIFLLLWMTLTHFVALRIFFNGFLLSRHTLPTISTPHPPWSHFPITAATPWPDTTPSSRILTSATTNLNKTHPPPLPFQKLILVVIDALRIDFILPSNASSHTYLNNLRLPYALHKAHPHQSLLLQTRADPPTTTSQRLKALMTGSLPTFIDAGSNFASTAVGEDHLLRHLETRLGTKAVLLGDETWEQLFGAQLDEKKSVGFESLKLFDLHTVDRGVTTRLFPLLEENDWKMVIAHFLGVDHCGHKHGPSHPLMAEKLREMDAVLERVVQTLDEDTLLLVLGDHGMTREGDHGGESVEELMAAAWVYARRPVRGSLDKRWLDFLVRLERRRVESMGWDVGEIQRRLEYDPYGVDAVLVGQIQLVPTLAHLMGVPTPFGNLGALIPDLVYNTHTDPAASASTVRRNHFINMFRLLEASRANAVQVYRYLEAYAGESPHSGFRPADLAPLLAKLHTAEHELEGFVAQGSLQRYLIDEVGGLDELADVLADELEIVFLLYDRFLSDVLRHCQQMWAQFDLGCMFLGLLLLGSSLFVLLAWTFDRARPSPRGIFGGALLGNFIGDAIVYSGLSPQNLGLEDTWFEKMTTFDTILASTVLASLLGSFLGSRSSSPSRLSMPALAIVLAHSLTLASNSYTVFEDSVVRFTCSSLVLWLAAMRLNPPRALQSRVVLSSLVTLAWIRVTGLVGVCREEQYPLCSYLTSQDVAVDGRVGVVVGVFAGVGLVFGVTWVVWARVTRDREGEEVFRSIYGGLLTLLVVRWGWMTWVNSEGDSAMPIGSEGDKVYLREVARWVFDIVLPRLVYGCCVVVGLAWGIWSWRWEGGLIERMRLFAWGMVLFDGTVLALLQRPVGGVVVVSFIVVFCLLLDDNDPSRLSSPSDSATSLNHTALSVKLALLHFLGHHLFFTTEHQAIFPAIHWEAAFVGLSDYSYYLGALLVGLTTFAGWILTLGVLILVVLDDLDPAADPRCLLDSYAAATKVLMMAHALPATLSAVFITILRRHLMTWKIFAPRFLLQCVLLVGADVLLCFLWVGVGWIVRRGKTV